MCVHVCLPETQPCQSVSEISFSISLINDQVVHLSGFEVMVSGNFLIVLISSLILYFVADYTVSY